MFSGERRAVCHRHALGKPGVHERPVRSARRTEFGDHVGNISQVILDHLFPVLARHPRRNNLPGAGLVETVQPLH